MTNGNLIINGWLDIRDKATLDRKYKMTASFICAFPTKTHPDGLNTTKPINLADSMNSDIKIWVADGGIPRRRNLINSVSFDKWTADNSNIKNYYIYYSLRLLDNDNTPVYNIYIGKDNPAKISYNFVLRANGLFYVLTDRKGKVQNWQDRLLEMVLYSPETLADYITNNIT